jgi:hypothetical protein
MAHFTPLKMEATARDVAKLYFNNIIRLHGIPRSIVSDRDGRFTSKFWKELMSQLGTELKFSTAFHP